VTSDTAEVVRELTVYESAIEATDIIDRKQLRPIQHGLFGEVGGIMTAAKKLVRERTSYPGYLMAAEEEFGDTLWYFAALCRRRGVGLTDVLDVTVAPKAAAARPRTSGGQVAGGPSTQPSDDLDGALMLLGRSAAALLDSTPSVEQLKEFGCRYVEALAETGISLVDVAKANYRKASGAFLEPLREDLADFDKDFGPEEQLPREFRIRVNQRATGKSYLQWNGVFIGDPLSDNITEQDGYRFHDVFHFANAAVLHWSPVIRTLIKHKRKSKAGFDEEQDGGRAIVVEEGLTAWIFSRAKQLNYFESETRVSLGILKTIHDFVGGYEVESCPMKLWEHTILQGFSVFRQLKSAEGGIIVGDRATRTLRYEPLGEQE